MLIAYKKMSLKSSLPMKNECYKKTHVKGFKNRKTSKKRYSRLKILF